MSECISISSRILTEIVELITISHTAYGGCITRTHNVAIYRSEMNHLPSSDTVARLSVKILEQLRQMGIRELGPFCDLTLLLLGLSLGFYAIDLGSCSSFGSICHGLETVFL